MKSPRKLGLLFCRHQNSAFPLALKSPPSLPASVWPGASVIGTWGLGGPEAQEIRPSSASGLWFRTFLLRSLILNFPHPLWRVRPMLSFFRWTSQPGFQLQICLHGDGSEMLPREAGSVSRSPLPPSNPTGHPPGILCLAIGDGIEGRCPCPPEESLNTPCMQSPCGLLLI